MPCRWVLILLAGCLVLNSAGFVWHLFEAGAAVRRDSPLPYAHGPGGAAAEIIYRSGGDDEFFDTPVHAVITGSVIGLLGAGGWEVIEVLLSALGASISNAPSDTVAGILLGVAGGGAGAWLADRYLDRIFGRSRWNSARRTVR